MIPAEAMCADGDGAGRDDDDFFAGFHEAGDVARESSEFIGAEPPVSRQRARADFEDDPMSLGDRGPMALLVHRFAPALPTCPLLALALAAAATSANRSASRSASTASKASTSKLSSP